MKHTTQASILPRSVPWALDQAENGDFVEVTRRGVIAAVIVSPAYFELAEKAFDATGLPPFVEEGTEKET